MKTVSEKYRQSMAQPLRERSYVEITFGNIDPTAAELARWSSPTPQTSWSDTDKLSYPIQGNRTVATTELNRNIFGSNYILLNANSQSPVTGFTSQALSGATGEADRAGNPIAILRCVFNESHTLPGLTLRFDTFAREWPLHLRIKYFDFYNQLIISNDYTDISDVEYSVKQAAEGVRKIDIEFIKMLPFRHPRVESVTFGIARVFTNNEITAATQTTDVDPLSRRTPKEEASFTIIDVSDDYDFDSPSGMWRFIDAHAPIKMQFKYDLGDHMESVAPDRYVLAGRPTHKNNTTTFKAKSLLNTLDQKFTKAQYKSQTLFDLATAVLTDANLTKLEGGENPWVISSKLKNITTNGILPIATHIECLQIIAHAACCRLYTDNSGKIRIEPFSLSSLTPTDFELDYSTIKDKSQSSSKLAMLRQVDVKQYSYTTDKTEVVLYSGPCVEKAMHAEFNPASAIRVEVTDGTLIGQTAYAQSVDIYLSRVTPNTVVTVYGKPINVSTSTVTKIVSDLGEVDTEQNPLITTRDAATALAEHVASYLVLRSTYKMDYRGNPELEVGDLVKLETRYSTGLQALVLVHTLKFDGALHGKLTVKSIGGATRMEKL